MEDFVEGNCTIEHEGRSFTAGDAYLYEGHVVAYLGKDGVLTTWHGEAVGTYRVVKTWKIPGNILSSTMSQVEAMIDGIVYTGRSCGEGMIYQGKRKAGKR